MSKNLIKDLAKIIINSHLYPNINKLSQSIKKILIKHDINKAKQSIILDCILKILFRFNFKNLSREIKLEISNFLNNKQLRNLSLVNKQNSALFQKKIKERLLKMIDDQLIKINSENNKKIQLLFNLIKKGTIPIEYMGFIINKYTDENVRYLFSGGIAPHDRSNLWDELIILEYKNKRKTFEELIEYINDNNIPDYVIKSKLWKNLIILEYKNKRKTFEELIEYIKNVENNSFRSEVWDFLIRSEYKKGKNYQDLEKYITEDNIPDNDIRSNLIFDLFRGNL